jgi:hypothetical protein
VDQSRESKAKLRASIGKPRKPSTGTPPECNQFRAAERGITYRRRVIDLSEVRARSNANPNGQARETSQTSSDSKGSNS